MNLSVKKQAYSLKGWATFLIVCLISFINCSKSIKHADQNIDHLTYINPVDIALGDSLAITAYLNDTVFTKNDLENNRAPSLSYKIINLFNHDISLPKNGYYVGSIENDLFSGVSIIVGQSDSLILKQLMSAPFLSKDEYFKPLKKNDSLLSNTNYDIMPFEHYSKLKPGMYWTYLVYRNYDWQRMSIPVWIGSIKSDTLWFKIM